MPNNKRCSSTLCAFVYLSRYHILTCCHFLVKVSGDASLHIHTNACQQMDTLAHEVVRMTGKKEEEEEEEEEEEGEEEEEEKEEEEKRREMDFAKKIKASYLGMTQLGYADCRSPTCRRHKSFHK